MVVDHHALNRGGQYKRFWGPNVVWVEPKPNVWQGRHRLTRRDYHALASARNTALCHAPDGHIAFVDDLSVLAPGWLRHVFEACGRGDITTGRFQRVNDLRVRRGRVVSFREWESGGDQRFSGQCRLECCPGDWLRGSNLVAPVEALLTINGQDEDIDPMGGEDMACGMMLEQHGFQIVYDPGMLILEARDLHDGQYLPGLIKPRVEGVSSFCEVNAWEAFVRDLRNGRKVAPNYCNMRELRARVLAGEPFPVPTLPDRDWRDGQLLSEM